ncbi:MAG: hypothetical protein KDB00_10850 [Planctomycetales bacterium]|nr:hypothetical protein [Planctomycetales bacterium]
MSGPNYNRDILPLEQAGKSDGEIAAYLSGLCNRPLACGTIVTLCSSSGAVVRDLDTELLGGPLWAALKASPDPLAAWFMRHVWMDRRDQITLDGTPSDVPGVNSFDVVVGFASLAAQIGAAAPEFEQLRQAFVSAAGGLRFPGGIDAAGVDALRQQAIADAAQALLDNRLINAKALFSERMTSDGDAAAVWSQAWTDAGVA